jgi:hypothetical protein
MRNATARLEEPFDLEGRGDAMGVSVGALGSSVKGGGLGFGDAFFSRSHQGIRARS